jgi:hypothetical protein
MVVGEKLHYAFLGLLVSHTISFVDNYLRKGEYRRANLQTLMMQPYSRVMVLHIAILGGGILMAALGSPMWGLLLLIGLKVALDLRSHLKERKRFGATTLAS